MIKKYLEKIKTNICDTNLIKNDDILVEIKKCEQKLNICLPTPLKEMYIVFGNKNNVFNEYHIFYPLDDLRIVDGALVFFELIDGYRKYGILMEDLNEDDPVVSLEEENDDEWCFESESLSEYILNNIFWNSLNLMKFKAKIKIKEENLEKYLKNNLYRLSSEPQFDVANKYSYYDKDEKIMATYFYYDQLLVLGSNDKRSLQQLEESMNCKFIWIERKITNDDIFN